jgi:hypothetical protein
MRHTSNSVGGNIVVSRTVYRFGSVDERPLGHVVLGPFDDVRCYFHPNESRYVLENGVLRFISATGLETSRLIWHESANMFLSPEPPGLYLMPVITLALPELCERWGRIVVNTIPKAGTYLVDRVLARIGYRSTKVHLSGPFLDDNRLHPEDDIHRAPHTRRRNCPASAFAELLAPGEYAVGHIADQRQLKAIASNGVGILHCIRDLKDVLVSLFHFKLRQVEPESAADRLWRSGNRRDAFKSFLLHYADKDIAHIKEMASLIGARGEAAIRFEDLVTGRLTEAAWRQLDGIEDGLGAIFAAALPDAVGTKTSTLSEARAAHEDYWNADIQAFFEATGLSLCNVCLGYAP